MGEYRDMVWRCRDEVRKAKAKLGNYLERAVNKKEFYKFIGKRRPRTVYSPNKQG